MTSHFNNDKYLSQGSLDISACCQSDYISSISNIYLKQQQQQQQQQQQ